MTDTTTTQLMIRARLWVERNQCPLPVDLAFEMHAEGINAQALGEYLIDHNTNQPTQQEVA